MAITLSASLWIPAFAGMTGENGNNGRKKAGIDRGSGNRRGKIGDGATATHFSLMSTRPNH